MPHGRGKLTTKEYTYDGGWIEGVADGCGDLQVDKYIYEGMFFDGDKCGRGTELMADGTKFSGDFAEGFRLGFGKLFDSKGDLIREGQFEECSGNSITIAQLVNLSNPVLTDEFGTELEPHALDPLPYVPKKEKEQMITKSDEQRQNVEQTYGGQGNYNQLAPQFKNNSQNQDQNDKTLRRVNSRGNHMDSKYLGGLNQDNLKDGYGIKIFSDDPFLDRYEGLWRDGNFDGYGVLKFKNGEKYDGFFSEGNFEGKGAFSYQDGSKYDGVWARGQKSGLGVYQYEDGSKLTGQFENDAISGLVNITYDDGGQYNGYYENNQIHGRGRMEYASKDIYEGRFGSELKEGFGIYKWEDGSIYAGFWSKDKPQGFGISVTQSQDVNFAIYSQGAKTKLLKNHNFVDQISKSKFIDKLNKIVKSQVQFDPLYIQSFNQSYQNIEESVFEGVLALKNIPNVKNVKDCENGKLIFKNDAIYRGGFKLNRFNGLGSFSYPERLSCTDENDNFAGCSIEGNWLIDQLHGDQGNIVSFKNFDRYEGGYFFGLRHGMFVEFYNEVSFTGSYEYGVRKGRGEMIKDDGAKILGTYFNNKLFGPVVFLSDDNLIYSICGCGFGYGQQSFELQCREPVLNDIEDCLEGMMKNQAGQIFNRMCFKTDSDLSEIRYADESIYKGQTLMGMRHGSGKQIWKDGSSYVGDWEYDLAVGSGTIQTANNTKYTGNVVDGQATGRGVFVDQNNSKFDGYWDKDVIIDLIKSSWSSSVDKACDSDNSVFKEAAHQNTIEFDSQMIDDNENSFSRISFPNGDYYDGTFNDNKGSGFYIKNSGDYYQVYIENGKFSLIEQNFD